MLIRDLMSRSRNWKVLCSEAKSESYLCSAFFTCFCSLFFLSPFPFSLSLSPSLPPFCLSSKSTTSFSKPSLGDRPLSRKRFQHCHYKLVEMIRPPGRLVLSLLQRGRCSTKPASDPPTEKTGKPTRLSLDPSVASASQVESMHILD